jgi:glycerophosphoryl diester phosphodiesterase
MNTHQRLQTGFTVFGHRGAAGLIPENTLPGFRKALDLGCKGIELDVHRVLDQDRCPRLCVIHDANVDRTTNRKGNVVDFSAEELSAMDAGDGAGVPLLDEVIALLPTSPAVVLNIELKGKNTAALTADLIQALPELSVLVSSFDHQELSRFRAQDPDTPVAPLFHRRKPAMTQTAQQLQAASINISLSMATPALIAQCQEAGFPVLVYTVNAYSDAERLKAMGVAGIFTDRPDLMMALQT